MINRNLYIVCSLLLLNLIDSKLAHAQDGLTIRGKVVDEGKQAVPFANAALYSTDSVLVTGAVSDDMGVFSIETRPGKYYLKITFLSYQEKIISNISLSNQDVNLGDIVLKAGSQVLEEVTVQSERSQTELYLDKRVFNVGKDLTNISGSAIDILDNVPSVTVDIEGNVSLRGSQNVRILIDGKPSGLTGINTADALSQVQANLIESIEVITNPSSRYDAEGEVGILNIILKKERKQGVNGAFTLNAGYPENLGGSFNMNMRRNKFNFFANYGIRYRSGPGSGYSNQIFKNSNFAYHSENTRNRSGWSHNLMAGVDFFFTEKSVLTASGIYRRSDGRNTSTNTFTDFDDNGDITDITIREELEKEPEDNSELALSYRKDFQKKGHYFTSDFKWIENIETEYANFTNTDVFADSVGQQRSTNTENERNILFQADYVQPIRNKGKFEAGLKGTHRIIDNDFLVEQLNGESNWDILPDYDNHLVYTENIMAAYAMLGNEINRFSYQIGLRGELTDITTELEKENETNSQNYFNLFPSTHLSYKITDDKTVQLSYSYRISRPGFRELMPFSNFSNNRSIFVGNPNLRPEYTNSLETAYLVNWETGSILSSAYYRYRTGVIERITVVDSVGYNRILPVNLATENAYGLEFNFTWNPNAWFRLNTNANFYRAITEGQYEDQVLESDTYTWTGRAIGRISFLKKWDFQASFNYRAPRVTPQGKNLSMYSLDLALARDVLKGNGTLTMSVRDLFNTRKFRNVVDTDELYAENEFQWRARQLMLTFTYRLNKKKENRSRDREFDGGDDGNFDGGGEF